MRMLQSGTMKSRHWYSLFAVDTPSEIKAADEEESRLTAQLASMHSHEIEQGRLPNLPIDGAD